MLRKFMGYFFVLGLTAILSGCATTEERCKKGNWYELGKNQALAGKTKDSGVSQWNGQCQEFGIQVDQGQYNNGYTDGLKQYCTNSHAYAEGAKNRLYNQELCTDVMRGALAKAHTDGKQVYFLNSQLNELNNDYSSLDSQLATTSNFSDANEIRREKTRVDRERRTIERELQKITSKY